MLTQKVDALHQVIDQVNSRVSEILSTAQFPSESNGIGDAPHPHIITSGQPSRGEALLMHKDILMDSVYVDTETAGDDHILSPEVQIQRLTAQLTAAYNRIAALEEQLLANRVY
ncbi:MAG TPA: hypothetical protein V6D02_16720 [Candidatus Obscuribacterales bacterium]